MEYVLTFHILNVYVDKTQPHQFKFTFNVRPLLHSEQLMSCEMSMGSIAAGVQ